MGEKMRILVTGGAGFIGSNFVHYMIKKYPDYEIVVLDKLTYAGRKENLQKVLDKITFIKGDIAKKEDVEKAVKNCDCIVNFAAETHVDRSVIEAGTFVLTDIYGAYNLLEAARKHEISKFEQISCYDAATRALTTEGFKTYDQIRENDLVFSLNSRTGEIEIKPVEKVIVQQYKGKMLHFKSKRVDLLVTPNHNMFILNTKKKLVIEPAEKAAGRSFFFTPDAHWKGKNEDFFFVKGHDLVKTKDLMYLLGIFIGDGVIAYQEKEVETKTGLQRKEFLRQARDKKTGRFKKIKKQSDYKTRVHSYRIFLDIPERDKCRKSVEKTLSNLGIKYHSQKGKAGEHIYFTSRAFMELFSECGRGAHNKHIPHWALDYSPTFLKHLLQGLLDSDGHGKVFHTTSEKLVRDFCELCFKLNLRPTFKRVYKESLIEGRKVGGYSYVISIGKRFKQITRSNIRFVDYDGIIWCLKVRDNKNFIVERNGKLDFCGNTDEVYGHIQEGSFREEDRLKPRNPYSATKAGAELLCQSYFETYGLPIVTTRSSNNYGPYQHPEKLIPKTTIYALLNKPIPVYGTGENVRDWLYVEDNCEAIDLVLHKGKNGETYNIAAKQELKNIDVVKAILKLVKRPESLIEFVKDRPGHDLRYSLNIEKITKLGWKPKVKFAEGIRRTVEWYKQNVNWWKPLIEREEIDFHKRFS
jgi:dTDP-D-glucose 4,6-dehydratase